jgi:hypothetical protein
MWQGIGEWLQLQARAPGPSEQENWLGWDAWVTGTEPHPGPCMVQENCNDR